MRYLRSRFSMIKSPVVDAVYTSYILHANSDSFQVVYSCMYDYPF